MIARQPEVVSSGIQLLLEGFSCNPAYRSPVTTSISEGKDALIDLEPQTRVLYDTARYNLRSVRKRHPGCNRRGI